MSRYSIIIPCHNAQSTLRETLDSLQLQTRKDWEALVVDCGSSDLSALIATEAAARDSRIRVLCSSGRNPAAARNMALGHAQGSVIAFCDPGDLWAPQKLAHLDTAFADPCSAAVFSRTEFFDAKRSRGISRTPPEGLHISDVLGENPVASLSSLAVRRTVFAESGGFDASIADGAEAEWLIRILGEGHRIAGLDRVLTACRLAPGSFAAGIASMLAGRRVALAAAAYFGHVPDARTEAIHLRWLARRALRCGAPAAEAKRLALAGCAFSLRGWFSDPRSGAFVLGCALVAPILPRGLRQSLFSN